eukprot:m.32634 g.32634  ORF g.32634 m.32634 type:complete len:327 (+) comp10912_c3_seq1:175-1155(+)
MEVCAGDIGLHFLAGRTLRDSCSGRAMTDALAARASGVKSSSDESDQSPAHRACTPVSFPRGHAGYGLNDEDDEAPLAIPDCRSYYIAEAFNDDHTLKHSGSAEYAEYARNVCRVEDASGCIRGTGFVLQEGDRRVVVTSSTVTEKFKDAGIFANFAPNPDQSRARSSTSTDARYRLKRLKLHSQATARTEVAILQFDDSALQTAPRGLRLREKGKSVRQDERCCLFGYPANADGSRCSRCVEFVFGGLRFSRLGTVLCLGKNDAEFRHSSFVLETSVGSPVLGEDWQVIGMHQREVGTDHSSAVSFSKIRDGVEAALQGHDQVQV